MIPIKQTKFGEEGNCMQACVASLLEMPLDKVPNYGMQADWFRDFNNWLWTYHMSYIEVPYPCLISATPGTVGILVGQTSRGLNHACVGRVADGVMEIMHDPSPSNAGLDNVESIGFFLKLDLARW